MTKIAFIGGSGLAQGLEAVLDDVKHSVDVKNRFGIVLSVYEGCCGSTDVVILLRHGDSEDVPSRSPAELVAEQGYEANIWHLYESGVTEAYGFSAVGALDTAIPLADTETFVVPISYIRGLAASQHSFGALAKNVHTNMGNAFDPALSEKARRAIEAAGYHSLDGTYIYNGGDTFETPAEIRVLNHLTAGEPNRVVGMTTVPEAILLKQMGIPFAAICSNVNYAEGFSAQTPVSHEQTKSVMEKAALYLIEIAREIVKGSG